jgi:ubiquinone/menaquinone biosynthesis C-methylase UbiE
MTGSTKECRVNRLAVMSMMRPAGGQKVLDIGAGTGAYTVPLSRLTSHVTVLEPSHDLREVLATSLAKAGVTNVSCIPRRWEDVSPDELDGPFDIVIAALSLTMPDIRPALEKMDRVCSGKVYLIWPVGVTVREQNYREAWPLIHGEPYVPGPGADVLFNVLYQMGICPEVQVYREDYEETFSSLNRAVEFYRPKYNASSPKKEMALRKYLGRKLDRTAEGLVCRGVSTLALISWDVWVNRVPV